MKPATSPDARGPALLVVQTSFLGDVVLTTPLVSALRRRLAPRRLALLVRPEAASLVAGHPDVDQVLVDDKRGADGGALGWLGTARRLRAERFEVAVSPHRSLPARWSGWRPARGGPRSAGRRRASRPSSARWRRRGRAASSSAPRRTRRSPRRSTIAPAVAPRCSPGARISPPWSRSSIAWR